MYESFIPSEKIVLFFIIPHGGGIGSRGTAKGRGVAKTSEVSQQTGPAAFRVIRPSLAFTGKILGFLGTVAIFISRAIRHAHTPRNDGASNQKSGAIQFDTSIPSSTSVT
jgi:hypothetical protein